MQGACCGAGVIRVLSNPWEVQRILQIDLMKAFTAHLKSWYATCQSLESKSCGFSENRSSDGHYTLDYLLDVAGLLVFVEPRPAAERVLGRSVELPGGTQVVDATDER